MAAQMTSGKVLREARERKGYELATVARRLRIRPDILRAIEAGDFASMPPRGYTRNMVNAYARLLGLNPTEIVNMYLDEAYAEQLEKARGTSGQSGFNMQRESRRSRSRAGDEPVGMRGYVDGLEEEGYRGRDSRNADNPRRTRVLYDDGTRYARDDYGVTRQRVERQGKSERDFLSHHSGYSGTGANFNFLDDRNQRGTRSIYAGQTPMQYSASRLPAFLQSRAVLIAAIALVVVVVVVVFVIVSGNRNAPADNDVTQLPVSGINDTTGTQDEAETAPVEVAPTSARVAYSVPAGSECYIETYTDGGEVVPEMLSGGDERTIDVTGTWTITTFSPDAIKVTVDGEQVQLAASDEYGGMYAYTVDFPAMLEAWKQTHTSRDAQRSAAVAEATAAGEASAAAAAAAAEEAAAQGQASGESAAA